VTIILNAKFINNIIQNIFWLAGLWW